MVPAAVVAQAIADLLLHLQSGDILIDGGNSYHVDDIRRAKALTADATGGICAHARWSWSYSKTMQVAERDLQWHQQREKAQRDRRYARCLERDRHHLRNKLPHPARCRKGIERHSRTNC
jgi:hypothetical protein